MSYEAKWFVAVLCVVLAIIAFCMWFFPVYGVWQSGMSGQARLREAEHSKQILIETARAEMEASKLRAQAIEIVGAAAQKFPEYRYQEFLAAFGDAIQNGNVDQIVYVPTEAGIPIVEAGRIGGR